MVAMDHFKDILKITTFFFPIHHHGYKETNSHVSFHVHESYINLNKI